MPTGILMMGPACGKSLLARATAGEASVPFLVLVAQSLLKCMWV